MPVAFRFDGLRDTLKAFHDLPGDLTHEGRTIVQSWGHAAHNAMRAAYPRHTGNLRAGVTMTTLSHGPFGVDVKIRNAAPHAHLFERGTRARYTKQGWSRGAMPKGRVFVPHMMRARERMYADIKAMLERAGLVVTGDA